jgi:hypothetical protein
MTGLLKFQLVTDIKKYIYISQVSVTHACNPSYSRSTEQEDDVSKPVWANNSRDPMSKNPSQK